MAEGLTATMPFSSKPPSSVCVGTGTSNGFNYAYHYHSADWFGVYECQVNRTLLDTPGALFRSSEFRVGGYIWYLEIKHRVDGHLGAYLTSCNCATLFVHRSFVLMNNSDRKENKCSGNLSQMEPFGSRGSHRLATIAKMKDADSGFISGRVFAVKVEVRVKLPENEQCVACCTDQSATLIWKLKYPRERAPWKLVSDDFEFRDRRWSLQLFPGGRDKRGRRASVYLHPTGGQATKLRFRFALLDPNGNDDFAKRTTHEFGTSSDGYGFTDFIQETELMDESGGYLRDGWVTLMMHLCTEDVTSHRPSSPPSIRSSPSKRHPMETQNETECVVCLVQPQTVGVLHGNTMHRCLCSDCAKIMESKRHLKCPICMAKVDKIIRIY